MENKTSVDPRIPAKKASKLLRLSTIIGYACHLSKLSIHVISSLAFYTTFFEITKSKSKAIVGAVAFFLVNFSFDKFPYRMDSARRASIALFLRSARIIIPLLEAILISEHSHHINNASASSLTEVVETSFTQDWLFIVFFAGMIYLLDYMTTLLPTEHQNCLHKARHSLKRGQPPKPIPFVRAGEPTRCCILIKYSIGRSIFRGIEMELSNKVGRRIDLGILFGTDYVPITNIEQGEWTLTLTIVSDNPEDGLVFVEILELIDEE